ncbi:MAG TPA: hypothetical protein VNW95_16540 [Mucilaginibacter sp.]|jgi:hypothetical protein|nr:hypothetical protein [Mucilaginibacter sp.]
MAETFLLQGTAKWSYDYEMAEFTETQKALASMTSFVPPLHRHEGNIALTNSEIIIEGIGDDDEDLTIQLNQLKQIYLGFDDIFPATSVKGLGLFWQPLRIEYYTSAVETQSVYLIIDFNGIYTHDKDWFKTLTQMLE